MRGLAWTALACGCACCYSAGAADSSEGEWTEASRWIVEPEPLLRLGTLDGSADETFVDISAIEILPDGAIVVADNGTSTVRVFETNGSLRHAFGARGEGPGEFSRLTSVGLYRADSLFTTDALQRRITIWSPTGEAARTFLLPPVPSSRTPLRLDGATSCSFTGP